MPALLHMGWILPFRELAVHSMAVTIYDVAKAAGVGIGTVSRVLNDNANVRPHTRRKVLEAIEALGYKPNLMARNLSRSPMHTVGVVVSYLTNPFQVAVLRGIQQSLAQAEVELLIFSLDSRERRDTLLESLSAGRRSDGLIVVSFSPSPVFLQRFRRCNLPVVVVDHYNPLLPSVYVNNVHGGYEATKLLLDLGHRRIGYIQDHFSPPLGPDGNWAGIDRRQGYLQALSEAGIPMNLDLIVEGKEHTRERGWAATELLLSQEDPPTAIFASSDMLALGTLEYAKAKGITVPEQLAVVGFDDIELASFAGLTTMRQPMEEMGRQSVSLVLDLLKRKRLTEEHCELPLQLVVRNSCGTRQCQD
jgi:LacI family transcriptional regulator